MNKGKSRKTEKKYLSVVFVPHSSNQVRVFKFTSFYGKLVFILAAVIITVVTGSVYLAATASENRNLKADMNTLYSANSEQKQLLDQKSKEIDSLKKEAKALKSNVDKQVSDINKRFNEMADKYLSNQTGTKSSRSGDRSEKSFASDLTELKNTIDALNKLSDSTDVSTVSLSETEKKLDAYMSTIPTLWPVQGRLSDDFGLRKDPIRRGTEYHEGLDIAVPYGTSIKAAADGKVTMASFYGGFGRAVIIDHGHGLQTLYGHTSKLLVKVGQKVKKGEVIAKAGSSGRSTGPHVHFEVMLYGTPVDPLNYLDSK